MLFQIKKTGNKTYRIDGNPYFIVGVVCFSITFVLGLISTKEMYKTFLYALGLTLLVIPIVFILDQVGKKKHKKILSSKLFIQLIDKGFEVEEQKAYSGLIGEKNQTVFRIYYDWNKLSKGFLSFGDIVIIAYYEPIVHDEEKSMVNEELLTLLNNRYRETMWSGKKGFSRFTPAYFIRHINYYPFTKIDKVLLELEKIADLIKENGLIPIERETLIVKQNEYGYTYAPPIDTFQL